jgi:hypothetical protein
MLHTVPRVCRSQEIGMCHKPHGYQRHIKHETLNATYYRHQNEQ